METARARGEEYRNQEAANCTQDKAGMGRDEISARWEHQAAGSHQVDSLPSHFLPLDTVLTSSLKQQGFPSILILP
jgi:hypothetical protein